MSLRDKAAPPGARQNPIRTGMIPPQLPGSPSYLRPGTPAIAKFLYDLGYSTGEFGKNHLGDHTAALPTAHGFQEYWGYLYHLDATRTPLGGSAELQIGGGVGRKADKDHARRIRA
jgi:arylsulfatase A-like enzyme